MQGWSQWQSTVKPDIVYHHIIDFSITFPITAYMHNYGPSLDTEEFWNSITNAPDDNIHIPLLYSRRNRFKNVSYSNFSSPRRDHARSVDIIAIGY